MGIFDRIFTWFVNIVVLGCFGAGIALIWLVLFVLGAVALVLVSHLGEQVLQRVLQFAGGL